MRPARSEVNLTDLLVSLPESLQRAAEVRVIKKMAAADCFEVSASRYVAGLDSKKRDPEKFFQFLISEGYTQEEARDIVSHRRHEPIRFHSTYGLENAASSCLGSAAARSVLADSLDTEWLRLWKAKASKENAAQIVSATVPPMVIALSPYDIAYLAARTALAAYEFIQSESLGSPFAGNVNRRNVEELFGYAINASRGRGIPEDANRVRVLRGIDYDARRWMQAFGDRDAELDERMREYAAQAEIEDEDEDEDEDRDQYADVPLDLGMLEVARLPIISSNASSYSASVFSSIPGPPMIDEDGAAEASYLLSAFAAANIVLWSMDDSEEYENESRPQAALDAAIAATILAHGDVRTVRSRRYGGNADRIYDPSNAALDILKLWRRIFPNPSLAFIL